MWLMPYREDTVVEKRSLTSLVMNVDIPLIASVLHEGVHEVPEPGVVGGRGEVVEAVHHDALAAFPLRVLAHPADELVDVDVDR